MGRDTRHFRQSARSFSADNRTRDFSKIIRNEGWHIKLINYLKVRGKNNV